MSEEEDDDRMDRARRIRRMREGDDERADDDEDVADDADETTAEEATTDPDDEDEQAATTEPEEPGEETESPADEDANHQEESDEESGIEAESEMEWGSPGGSGEDTAAEETAEGEADAESVADLESDDEDGISAPLPGADQLEEALEESDADAEAETVAPDEVGGEDTETESEEETRVLEFTLHDEHYCLDIDFIEEIVKEETVTRVPNTPQFVEGVVDLRGQITTILNPKVTIGKPDQSPGDLIVVFDSEAFEDQGHIGWVVDDVRQVSLITDGDVNDPPVEQKHVNGVIDRDDEEEFVVWTTPELVFDDAESAD